MIRRSLRNHPETSHHSDTNRLTEKQNKNFSTVMKKKQISEQQRKKKTKKKNK